MKNSISKLQNKSILYIEDDIVMLSYISELFKNWFNKVYISENGEDGYEKFLINKLDLIVTDIDLPLLNGIEMIKRIREADKEIPIIITTAYHKINFEPDISNLNISYYIQKPLTFKDIQNTIIEFANSNKIDNLKKVAM